jgi:hypothetical protein
VKYELHNEPFPYLIVDDYYDPLVEKEVFRELSLIEKRLHHDGKVGYLNKHRLCVFMGEMYGEDEPHQSIVFRANHNIIPMIFERYRGVKEYKDNWFFYGLRCDKLATLFSYYENNTYYESHADASFFTGLTWMYHRPRKFEGGDLIFTDYDVTIECVHNRTIFFPGIVNHSVTEVLMKPEDEGKGLGRWCISNFGSFKD